MDRHKFSADISETFNEIREIISKFDEQNFNKIPFESSWTAGQVVQHIVLVAGGFADTLFGNTTEADRPTDKWLGNFEEAFLNFDIRMDAPEMVVPEQKNYKTLDFESHLAIIEQKLKKAVEELDLELLCIDFEVPVTGFLTRKEGLAFALYHTKRHIHQLRDIEMLVNFEEERIFRTEHTFDVSQEKLFDAWTNPEILKRWWGPNGFTTTINEFDLRAGGHWRLVMHGPDGRDFDNHAEFIRVDKPKLLTWFRHTAPFFKVIVEFKKVSENQTSLKWDMIFKDSHTTNQMRSFLEEKNAENIEKLNATLNP